MEKVL
jgi:hypothetical protein